MSNKRALLLYKTIEKEGLKLEKQNRVTKGVTNPSFTIQEERVFKLLIESSFKPPSISKTLKISRKQVYKHISKMIKKGFLQRKYRGGYIPMAYHVNLPSDNRFRIHSVQVFYDLPLGVDKYKWRRNRGRVLSLKKMVYDKIILRNRFGITDQAPRFFVFDKYDARCHANGIMVYLPEIRSKTAFDGESELLTHISLVGEELSRIFRLDFIKENTLKVRIINYHISHIKDVTAKILRKESKNLFVYLEGERRVICDYSGHIDEMEGLTIDKGVPDIRNLQRYIGNILKEGDKALLPENIRKDLVKVNQNLFLVSKALKQSSHNEAVITGQIKGLAQRIEYLEGGKDGL